MASYPNYDLNDYGTIFDDALKTKLDTELAKIDAKRSTYESEEAYAEARSAAINSAVQSQWRNKCIDSTYEPGSTYKPITLAAALEEGKVTKNSTFYCSGSTQCRAGTRPSTAPTTAATVSRPSSRRWAIPATLPLSAWACPWERRPTTSI